MPILDWRSANRHTKAYSNYAIVCAAGGRKPSSTSAERRDCLTIWPANWLTGLNRSKRKGLISLLLLLFHVCASRVGRNPSLLKCEEVLPDRVLNHSASLSPPTTLTWKDGSLKALRVADLKSDVMTESSLSSWSSSPPLSLCSSVLHSNYS